MSLPEQPSGLDVPKSIGSLIGSSLRLFDYANSRVDTPQDVSGQYVSVL